MFGVSGLMNLVRAVPMARTVNTRSATMLTGSLMRSLSFVNSRTASSPTWLQEECNINYSCKRAASSRIYL